MQSRILVIDDCRLTRAITRDILEASGFEVLTAESALDANPLIDAPVPPDLILMDVVMPELSGDRKVRRMKAREESRGIPVVLISTKPHGELQQLAKTAGADGFLQKPLCRAQLLGEIGRLLPN
jgi:CheY-like chemotaxis protein